ncbi:hypothetical protein ACFQS7_07715 [Dankookia sp. GCM10030260]|uniref:hypothetical protein n=1 Tax=Dankookia sp. GCM10030260 TaxID=3273390 RepID=UPI003609B2D2
MNQNASHALQRDNNHMETTMKRMIRRAAPALLLLGLAACQQEGPAERAGRSLDRAGQSVRDTVDPPRGPVERLGRSVDRAVN